MFLMFFIGGLFMHRSITAKGIPAFIRDRTYRLLLPFLIGGTTLMLLAYFPSYYIAKNDTSLTNYIKDFFTIEAWPVGPPWFIWVLFAFNLLFALLYPLVRRPFENIAKNIAPIPNSPARLFLLFYILTWILYVPIAYTIGAGTWTGWGPFDFQLSRILAYFGYFLLGSLVGAYSPIAPVTKHWKPWIAIALFCYTVLTLNSIFHLTSHAVQTQTITQFTGWMLYYTLYVASCTASCIAFLIVFRNKVNTASPGWTSLSQNAYLIYLLHYPFVTWTQFLLLKADIPAVLKFLLVFLFSLLACWGLSSLLRRIPLFKKYL